VTRLRAAAAIDLRSQWRYGILAVAGVLTAAWTSVLLVMPAAAARAVAPYLLFVDTATFGVFFIAALVLFERTEGALASLVASPLRTGEYLAAKLTTLTAIVAVAALPITMAAARAEPATVLRALGYVTLGVTLASLLFLALSLYLVAPHRTLTGFLARAPWPMIPFLLVPLLHLADLITSPLWYAVPTVGAAELLRAGLDPAAVTWPAWAPVAAAGYLAASAALVLVLAGRRLRRDLSGGTAPRPAPVRHPSDRGRAADRRPNAVRAVPSGSAVRRDRRRPPAVVTTVAGMARLDLRNVRGDGLLIVSLAAPLLLAVALRLGYPGLVALADDRFGLDLAPFRPVAVAALVLLHVPLMAGMMASLLLLDDLDERHLNPLRVTPLTVRRYAAYRLGITIAVSLGSLAACLPLSGLATGYGTDRLLVATLLAAAQAGLVLLAVGAFAANKVEGLAMLKLLGAVLMAAPLAAWWVTDGWPGWIIGLLPPVWPARALWAGSGSELLTAALVGAVVTVAAGGLLARRAAQRLAAVG
jgi:fluoroquinolone transport system permease protein